MKILKNIILIRIISCFLDVLNQVMKGNGRMGENMIKGQPVMLMVLST